MTQAVENTIRRLLAVFGEPRTDNPELLLMEYRRALAGLDAEALELATNRVIDRETFWPRPSVVRHEAVAILAARRKPAEHQPIEPRVEPTPEQRERVAELMRVFRRAQACVETSVEPVRRADCPDRETFEAMQRKSRNTQLHRRWP